MGSLSRPCGLAGKRPELDTAGFAGAWTRPSRMDPDRDLEEDGSKGAALMESKLERQLQLDSEIQIQAIPDIKSKVGLHASPLGLDLSTPFYLDSSGHTGPAFFSCPLSPRASPHHPHPPSTQTFLSSCRHPRLPHFQYRGAARLRAGHLHAEIDSSPGRCTALKHLSCNSSGSPETARNHSPGAVANLITHPCIGFHPLSFNRLVFYSYLLDHTSQ
ncbi:uncharacterized protein [Gorilla gorilla gorilla]|uniref:uncharacterized protein n=1 Tax=Gorilla gorilla gorilla TaxID=9595 RepID=UPI003008F43D